MIELIAYFDGLCGPYNPGGYACYGYLIKQSGTTLITGKGFVGVGPDSTNNVAEYAGLIQVMKAAADIEHNRILIRGDSQLIINQVNGKWQCYSRNLRPLFNRANELLTRLNHPLFEWIPRERNQDADKLSRQAYADVKEEERIIRKFNTVSRNRHKAEKAQESRGFASETGEI